MIKMFRSKQIRLATVTHKNSPRFEVPSVFPSFHQYRLFPKPSAFRMFAISLAAFLNLFNFDYLQVTVIETFTYSGVT